MKKLLLLFCCAPLFLAAQNFHFSIRGGLAGYQGDLKQGMLSQLGYMASLGALYDLSEHVSARTYFTLCKLKGDDKKGTAAMQERNLNFQTSVLDWKLGAQYNIFSLNDRWWTPYLAAGVGLFHFNPYTKNAAGGKVLLQPLGTEGQGLAGRPQPYKRTQFSLPLAIGINYSTGRDTRVGIEFGYRKLFTDYLDDVSTSYADESVLRTAHGQQAVDLAWRTDEVTGQSYPSAGTGRGNPEYKDAYYYIAITFSIRYWFDKYKQVAGLPKSSRDKKVGCPASKGW